MLALLLACTLERLHSTPVAMTAAACFEQLRGCHRHVFRAASDTPAQYRLTRIRASWRVPVMYGANSVLVTAPVQPCPLPTFVTRNADLNSARWITDRALAVLRTGVVAPFSFANGLYLAPVP
jgi:hypothetical protein